MTEIRSSRAIKLSALYRARVAADPEGFSRMMSERTRRAWAEGKLLGKPSTRTPANEVLINAFITLDPRPPWKVLAGQLGVQEKTVVAWRKAMGLKINPRDKRFAAC
jgi:hypothetical protein